MATRPLRPQMSTVAVVGAGISGLMCARTLADHGFPVTVFEKSRGVGGRMATRRAVPPLQFDHGAQYFTVRDKRFRRYVRSWVHDGIVAPWEGKIVELERGTIRANKQNRNRFVAIPGMNAVGKHLAEGLDVRTHTDVAPLRSSTQGWRLTTQQGEALGEFDVVIVSAPAGQTACILEAAPTVASVANETTMSACWALMLAFPSSLDLPFDGAFVHNSAIAWIAKNSSKPGRSAESESWVVHASPKWSERNIDLDASTAGDLLLSEFWKATGGVETAPSHQSAHRWRFAIPLEPASALCLFDPLLRVGACGDWCGGPRIEGAFLSGLAAAGCVMGSQQEATPRA